MSKKAKKIDRRQVVKTGSLVTFGFPTIVGCLPKSAESTFQDLNQSNGPTVLPPGRTPQDVALMFEMERWVIFSDMATRDECYKQLAAIPDVYLDFLKQRAFSVGFQIQSGGGGGGYMGFCRFDDVGATEIQLAGMQGVKFATIHEVGHGVESFTYEQTGQGQNGYTLRSSTFNQVVESAEASLIRSYAKSKPAELWADGFSSVYRNPASRRALDGMPLTKKYLQACLVRPLNLSPNEDPSWHNMPTKGNNVGANAPGQNTNIPAEVGGNPQPGQPNQPAQPIAQPPVTNQPINQPLPINTSGVTQAITNACLQIGNRGDAVVQALCAVLGNMPPARRFDLAAGPVLHMPLQGQYLTAYDRVTVLLELPERFHEFASELVIRVNGRFITKGIARSPFVQGRDLFSRLIQIDPELTPTQGAAAGELKIETPGGKTVAKAAIHLSSHSMCGDPSQFRDSFKK